ncbi:MAG: hypothetical protein KGZ30_01665 [Anaplasmataceae bacterium]|nr:hypothetical protein [Anaplasmataceae bacterium]
MMQKATTLDEVIVEALRRYDAGESPEEIFKEYPRYHAELENVFRGSSKHHQSGRQLRHQ